MAKTGENKKPFQFAFAMQNYLNGEILHAQHMVEWEVRIM